jgi:hypothetical protein
MLDNAITIDFVPSEKDKRQRFIFQKEKEKVYDDIQLLFRQEETNVILSTKNPMIFQRKSTMTLI